LYLNEQEVNINALADEVRKKFGAVSAVYVRADKDTLWEVVAQVISAMGDAKIGVNVVTQPEDEAEKGKKRR
jgi:biopolymer transport protein ExbD